MLVKCTEIRKENLEKDIYIKLIVNDLAGGFSAPLVPIYVPGRVLCDPWQWWVVRFPPLRDKLTDLPYLILCSPQSMVQYGYTLHPHFH